MTTVNTSAKVQEPSILTANTYFWTSSSSANGRRRSEQSKINEVSNYLSKIGFVITEEDENNVCALNGAIEVRFHYSESCKNVYKSLAIFKAGKKSNITALRKIANS